MRVSKSVAPELLTFKQSKQTVLFGPFDRLPASATAALKAAHGVEAVGGAVAWVSPRDAFIHI